MSKLNLTLAAAVLALAVGATPAQADSHLTRAEANVAIATLDDGRTYDLVQPVFPAAEFGQVRLVPNLGFDRLGRRAALVSVMAASTAEGRRHEFTLFTALVRERPRSGRIVVRRVIGPEAAR